MGPVPGMSNANYGWILHILSKLNPTDGVGGFLLANGALDDEDTVSIRKQLIENDKVEAIIVLPREMFYSTDAEISALTNNCDRTWTTQSGVPGLLVKGRGAYVAKSIFLRASV